MPHPFGNLVTQYRHRKHHLSQNNLAKYGNLPASVFSRMCKGERLTGKYGRERVLRVIFALVKAGAIQYQGEANALLEAADKAALKENELWAIAESIQTELVNLKFLDKEIVLIKGLHQRCRPAIQKYSTLEQLKDTLSPPSHPGRYIPVPEYARLFGVQAEIHRLVAWFGDIDGPKFLSIEGMGGIGKTALAREVARTLTHHGQVTAVLWVSARHERLAENGLLIPATPVKSLNDIINHLATQLGLRPLVGLPTAEKLEILRSIFNAEPYLVVVDNLETFSDTESLLPALYPLAGKSRFLLTSRHTLKHFPYVYAYTVAELSVADSQVLVASEVTRHGHPTAVPPAFLAELYRAIGGLPLALKLAAAQVGQLSPTAIITGLQEARATPEKLYTFIYQRTWLLLDDLSRHLLLALLPVGPAGEDIDFIQALSQLPENDFDRALSQLRDYSLIEVENVFNQPRYRLHRLTITFLHTEVLQQW